MPFEIVRVFMILNIIENKDIQFGENLRKTISNLWLYIKGAFALQLFAISILVPAMIPLLADLLVFRYVSSAEAVAVLNIVNWITGTLIVLSLPFFLVVMLAYPFISFVLFSLVSGAKTATESVALSYGLVRRNISYLLRKMIGFFIFMMVVSVGSSDLFSFVSFYAEILKAAVSGTLLFGRLCFSLVCSMISGFPGKRGPTASILGLYG